MAELVSHEYLEGQGLRLVFELTNIENLSSWEGWLYYNLKLYNGDELVSGITQGSILKEDIVNLRDNLVSNTYCYFEPSEPDFQLILNPGRNQEHLHNGAELIVMIDEGSRRKPGQYAGSGLGARFLVDSENMKNFTKQLKQQYRDLTVEAGVE